jgi:hypothetical protein
MRETMTQETERAKHLSAVILPSQARAGETPEHG